ncbi:MFS transporter [Nocardioides panaciterrulae]|uniref:Uncharacterized protein n=1 Tax=Nocardioides panaciterrulae TaxID=661492 RepID=A0A7Y9J9Z1_9ACTN|nr:MFS transporter [Nocardioides panaciterrulae]NYD41170.1 hypothetical protein [Nocardioides panaciterrulae]
MAASQLLTREPAAPAPERRPLVSRHPVLVTTLVAAALHVLWWALLATSGGDIAAQDAWAEFARAHPDSAYNLAWYGGMHPVSYSVLSPYVMAVLGVRPTMMLAGTVSSGLLALLLVRSRAVARPLWPALFGAAAFAGNAVSGRVTFGLGLMFGLAAVAAVFVWPQRWRTPAARHRWPRAAVVGLLAAAATTGSPVAGLFVGIVAAALWLGRRRAASLAIGLPPVAVVALSAWLFPFSGQQPMPWASMILPLAFAAAVFLLSPSWWRTVRLGAVLYAVGVVAVWVIPSQIGTNITRLGLIFGGVLVVAVAVRRPAEPLRDRWPAALHADPRRVAAVLAAAVLTSAIWQVATATRDVVGSRPAAAWTVDVHPLLRQLAARHAGDARVEVVPAASHRESSALSPYVNLARGWNRQADAERNPLFYADGALTPRSYRHWLHRWAVHFVVLSSGEPDQAGLAENALVARGLPYLRKVWSDPSWSLYAVREPTSLVQSPAVVTSFDAAEVVLFMPRAGDVLVRVPDSPWLSLVDQAGEPIPAPAATTPGGTPVNTDGCLSQAEPMRPDHAVQWTVLHAPAAGTYRIAAPYKLPRGTACPDELLGTSG